MTWFADCHFNEAIFLAIGGEKTAGKWDYMEWTISIAYWSSHKIMWVRSVKDYAFTRDSKSIARYVH